MREEGNSIAFALVVFLAKLKALSVVQMLSANQPNNSFTDASKSFSFLLFTNANRLLLTGLFRRAYCGFGFTYKHYNVKLFCNHGLK